MDPKIIYEDDDILALDKPAGMLVHPVSSSQGGPHINSTEKTLSDWVVERYPETAEVGEPLKLNNGEVIKRPGIVHRIDKETSGVLLVVKNQKAFEYLKDKFKNREIEKTYRTFVWGNFSENSGVIDKPIGRSSSDFRKKSAEKGSVGPEREAETHYKVLEQGKEHAYLEVYPKTGRTHQIRVHLKSIGRPIVCDSLYAPKKEKALGFERLALHAFGVTFKNLSGQTIVAEAPLPEDFLEAEKMLQ